MHYRYTVSDSDFALAQETVQAHFGAKAAARAGQWKYLLVLWPALVLLVLTCLQSTVPGIPFLPDVLSHPLAWVAVIVLVLLAWQGSQLKAFFGVLRDATGPFPMACELTVSDEGITLSSPVGSHSFPWASVLQVVEGPAAVLLLIRNGICIPVPLAAFASAGDMKDFAAFAAGRAGA